MIPITEEESASENMNDTFLTLKRDLTSQQQLVKESLLKLKDDLEIQQWSNLHATEFWVCIEEWKIKNIQIINLKQSAILKSLPLIKFPCLRTLTLSGMDISSLEPLSMIELPTLQSLNIRKNKITQIGILKKAYFPNMIRLYTGRNFILDFANLSLMRLNYLLSLYLESILHQQLGNGFDLRWIAKIQTHNLSQFYYCNKVHISQLNFQSIIRSRWKQICIRKKSYKKK